jgi:hypothetical protein
MKQIVHQTLSLCNKIKNKKYHTVETIPKSNIKIAERSKIDTTITRDTFMAWYINVWPVWRNYKSMQYLNYFILKYDIKYYD